MRADLIRIYKSLHTWTGILSGMALFIAFYAGAITLFKEQVVEWATPPTVAAQRTASLAEANSLIARAVANRPEAARQLELNIQRSPAKPDFVSWTVSPEGSDEHDTLSVRHFTATLADDGSARTQEVQRSHLGELIDVLHRVVGLPADGDVPRLFMGVIAVLYFLALFSGVVVLLPSLVKDLFALRVGPNLKRMWLDAHNVVGLGSLPFHVVMALTAAVFAFHDPIYLAQNSLIHEGKLGAMFGGRGAAKGAKTLDPAEMLPPTALLARVANLSPTFEPTMLRYVRVRGPNPNVMVFGHDTRSIEQRALGGLAILDPYNGEVVTAAYLPGHQSVAETFLASFFALHFGSYGGKPVKWLYFALAMAGAWLFYSGNLLWIETRSKKAKRNVANGAVPLQRRDVRMMAAATIGVCLGSVCGISLTLVCAKWLHALSDLNDWHRIVYYAVFFAAIGWSFLRGAARASVDLLRMAAALTLAVPLTSLAAALLPSLGIWCHTTLPSLAVDGTALALGLAYVLMARATARRVLHGRPDSVWSANAPVLRDARHAAGASDPLDSASADSPS